MNSRALHCFFALITACFPFVQPCAQTGLQFAHIDFSRGLSNSQVNAVYKDSRGFMWLGTMSGLNRYDGYQFKIFRHNLADTTSLNDNYIARICEDPFKKLWIQTREGYNIYDPETEKFTRNPAVYLKTLSLPVDGFTDVIQTKNGFWILYSGAGIYHFTTDKKARFLHPVAGDAGSISGDPVTDIKDDAKGFSWLVHANGLTEKLDSRNGRVVFRTELMKNKNGGRSVPYHLFIDRQNDIWFYSVGYLDGVYCYQPGKDLLKHLYKTNRHGGLNNNLVNGMAEDDNGLIWIGTDHGGVNLFNRQDGSVRFITNKPDDNNSLSQNCITTLYEDGQGGIWAGTYKGGVSYYHQGMVRFPWYRHQPSVPNSLPFDDVNRFVENDLGNLWIGTNGGGLIYFDRHQHTFRRFLHDPSDPNSLSNNVVVSMWLDHRNILWIGTYFGGLDSYDGKRFTHYRHDDAIPGSIADDRVWEIYEDSGQNLWVGTLDGGLDRFDRDKKIFIHNKSAQPNSVHSDYIAALAEDGQRNLWIGTSFGIDVRKSDRQIIHYTVENNKLSNNNIIAIFKDSRGNMWVGTREGLNVFNPEKQQFQSFRMEDGLPDNTILTIVEDDQDHLWVTTPSGISRISVKGNSATGFNIHCKNYDETDGLQGHEFNENAALKTRSGELVMGGANGMNIFNPSSLGPGVDSASIVLTDFQIFNKSVHTGEKVNGKKILDKSISETDQVTLKYNQNVFSIEFASLSFVNTAKYRYAYKLEGFDKDWLIADGKARKATYTNLDPGKYIFRVEASNEDGVWSESAKSLNILILPPFWKTPLAYLCYLVFLAGMLVLSRRMIIQRARMRFALENEREEAQRMHELDMMKIKFFTNVSHEFRTPLSLILTPLDKIIRDEPDHAQKKQFNLIHRNARRLLNLVNQLLDFRKMEAQELKLNPVKGDIVRFVREISYSFSDLAEQKNIRFSFQTDIDQLYTTFDHDKIERILFNLLSNAFKFTLEKGTVGVELQARRNEKEMLLEIRVRDSGIGIPAEKQEKIFERFFQQDVPGSLVNQGSGIGLSITREFVKLHQGTIHVESELEKGSCFIVRLPFSEFETILTTEPLKIARNTEAAELNGVFQQRNSRNGKPVGIKPSVILLVEDNEDFRFYLKDNLRQEFSIVEAANGREGWQKALALQPDLVVTDISMPLMNGIELCRKIKSDPRTEQIPVILLTALTGEEEQLRGLETGASDYITKPFSFEVMVSRIKNILAQQQALKKTFTRKVEARPTETAVESTDQRFVQQALEIVEKNLSDPAFSVEDLSHALFMSRISVYKRLLSLTGKTPIEFIRSIRLDHAARLMEKSRMTIAEVAYEVGFNNPKYFTKYFKAAFNMLPSAYMAAKKKETGTV